jgi:nuclear factor I
VILRPGDQLNSSSGHDPLSIQRYATHPATRLVSVGQSRQDEVLLHQQQQQHSALTQQAVSPGSVFYQHSPSASDVNAGDNHNQSQEGDGSGAGSGSAGKYGECQTNGHDTLSDFVTFVCQESEQGGQNQSHRNSPKSQQYPQYNTMLPPPPLPPMARPVAIIRSSDLTMVNSPPASITPPTTMSSPHQEHQDSHMGQNDVNHSPPLSPQSHMDRKALTRIASPYSNGRDYTFNHFHPQQAQVSQMTSNN